MRRWGLMFCAFGGLAAISAFIYLAHSQPLGFPLDDAWIHQTYARNLGLWGAPAFFPGQPSTASTSPGWTLLLALGYRLGFPYLFWAYFWGSTFAAATALLAAQLSVRYFGNKRGAFWVGAICLLEWHLAWAAVSGMEISLFTFWTLLYLYLLDRERPAGILGVVAGMLVVIRPEGVLLGAVYGFKLLVLDQRNWKAKLVSAAVYALLFAIVVSPLVAFNLAFGGTPFPSTVYAKYMQYGYPWTITKTLQYWIETGIYFVRGPLLLTTPLVIFTAQQAWKLRQKSLMLPLIWIVGLISLYSVALPSIYHHGRYLMPLIPLIIVFGVQGLRIAIQRFSEWRAFWSTYILALGVMVVMLWLNGASSYTLQVSLLTENQLKVANWLRTHTPPEAVVATHDIGLLGYFGERRLVDLAGLVTPAIVPLLRDQAALAEFCKNESVSYVAVFSGYYRPMLEDLNATLVFSPDSEQMQALKLEPFEVYQLPN